MASSNSLSRYYGYDNQIKSFCGHCYKNESGKITVTSRNCPFHGGIAIKCLKCLSTITIESYCQGCFQSRGYVPTTHCDEHCATHVVEKTDKIKVAKSNL
ncbi:MAG: hypothetical protein Faunusvirus1_54 [Faunusvirus sp.]|jgi:hypothetical protein|uniref:Uncharacterized protein n=1 Tax=Faunusvirus sp. TaxID=2487766 RepID=A0A3G4ZXG8_9VIRU|nr:MAG: hypothetical protein Faunusvirus1_54 [Faunusvirus sp.]